MQQESNHLAIQVLPNGVIYLTMQYLLGWQYLSPTELGQERIKIR